MENGWLWIRCCKWCEEKGIETFLAKADPAQNVTCDRCGWRWLGAIENNVSGST